MNEIHPEPISETAARQEEQNYLLEQINSNLLSIARSLEKLTDYFSGRNNR